MHLLALCDSWSVLRKCRPLGASLTACQPSALHSDGTGNAKFQKSEFGPERVSTSFQRCGSTTFGQTGKMEPQVLFTSVCKCFAYSSTLAVSSGLHL
eukprot:862913-Amphidinium_carterae.1